MTTIQESVAAKIAESGEKVKETVVDILTNSEINKRVDLITSGIKKQEQLEKEFKKIDGKNDITTYVDNVPVGAMSQGQYEKIKKAKEALNLLTGSLNAALETNTIESYNKLTEILKKVENAGGNQKESEPKAESKP